jgi:hypothetical protein
VSRILSRVSKSVTGAAIDYEESALAEVLSPAHFVRVRRTHGGPAPEETARAIEESRAVLTGDQTWMREAVAKLREGERALRESTAAL